MSVKKCISWMLIVMLLCSVQSSVLASGSTEDIAAVSVQIEAGEIDQKPDDKKEKNGEILSLLTPKEVSLNLPCRTALLMCADTGDVLYEKDGDKEVPMASITKVMTLLLTMEALEAGTVSRTDFVPVSEHAYCMGGSQIWLEPGEKMTLDDMLKAICVSSANDAAVAVGEYIGGSEPLFVEMMNQRAKELGMEHTHFVNACGLDADGHYSTAYDVALMSRELLKHPLILEYSGIWQDSLREGKTQLVNTNKLLKRYQGITGLKTGTTGKAGICITATATRDGMTLIAVVLGSSTKEERFQAATAMLDYGFATCQLVKLPSYTVPQTIKVHGGEKEKIALQCRIPTEALVYKDGEKEFCFTEKLPQKIEAPVSPQQKIGTVVLMQGEKEITEFPVYPECAVEKLDFKRTAKLLLQEMLRL